MGENQIRTYSGLNILAGIWLMISPFLLSYNSGGNISQQVFFGVLVAIFGIMRLSIPSINWPSWLNVLIGIWLIIAPWTISGTTTAAHWNEVITGIIVVLLALASAVTPSGQTRRIQQK